MMTDFVCVCMYTYVWRGRCGKRERERHSNHKDGFSGQQKLSRCYMLIVGLRFRIIINKKVANAKLVIPFSELCLDEINYHKQWDYIFGCYYCYYGIF